jgi:hypothetical protein
MNDLRLALRQLSKHPGFASVAVLTLAVGIAATTTVFCLADALPWRLVGSRPGELHRSIPWKR